MRPILLALVALAWATTASGAELEKRIALVVGNSAYQAVTPLANPRPDASLMAETLEKLGFDVRHIEDASLASLRAEVAKFGRNLRAAGQDATGLFYFAGHGLQSFGTNYLLPVDASVTDPADLDLVALEASAVLRQMASARNRTNIVILDACRDNPFVEVPEFGDNGLAEMKAPTGTFLAYATAPGSVAYDGAGTNSPFTEALAEAIQTPGVPIEQAFKKVRVSVLKATGSSQTPWDTSSLTVNFSFIPQEQPSQRDLAAKAMWDQAKASRDELQILLFLRAYPDSAYEQEARTMLSRMVSGVAPPAPQAPVAPKRTEPTADEKAMIETARTSGSAADYESYLEAYPQGVFAELAHFELSVLAEKAAQEPAAEAPETQIAAVMPPGNGRAVPPVTPPVDAAPVTFTSPSAPDSPLGGKSIAEIIETSPLHPPLEGLPESYWKDKACSNCHEWNPDRLCEQAQVYISDNSDFRDRSLAKQHPYDGALKRQLRAWAQGGCR